MFFCHLLLYQHHTPVIDYNLPDRYNLHKDKLERDSKPSSSDRFSTKSEDFQVTSWPGMDSFKNDALVRVAAAEVKKVEDIVTADFIKASIDSDDKSIVLTELKNIEVVSETNTANLTLILEDTNVTLVCQDDQPFFTFCAGWSSLFPPLTMAKYGLSCKVLSMGDNIMVLRNKHGRKRRHEIRTSIRRDFKKTGKTVTQVRKDCNETSEDDDEQPIDLSIKRQIKL